MYSARFLIASLYIAFRYILLWLHLSVIFSVMTWCTLDNWSCVQLLCLWHAKQVTWFAEHKCRCTWSDDHSYCTWIRSEVNCLTSAIVREIKGLTQFRGMDWLDHLCTEDDHRLYLPMEMFKQRPAEDWTGIGRKEKGDPVRDLNNNKINC